jgi:DNA polymerase-1
MAWNIELPSAHWFDLGSEGLDGLIREVMDQPVVAIDTETTGLSIHADEPLFWSLSWDETRVCMPVSTMPLFRRAFADTNKAWVLANAKFDMHMLANNRAESMELAGHVYDISVMHALLYEEDSHALKDMAKQVLGWRWSDFFDTFKPQMVVDSSKHNRVVSRPGKPDEIIIPQRRESVGEMLHRAHQTNLPLLVEYASNDAYGTMKLFEALKKKLEATNVYSLYPQWLATMSDVFFKTEAPFTRVLWECERNGVYVNRAYMESLRGPMGAEVNDLNREMVFLSGNPLFNSNSRQHLCDYFITKKGLRPLTSTKGGATGIKQPSIDKGFLEHYEHEEPMAALMLRHRKLSKLIGTYIDGANKHYDSRGRIHTRFNQDVARTGRLSSSDPNLQNIPQPDKDKFKLRGGFQAEDGNMLIVGDYEQLEMRLLACATVTDKNPEGARDMIQLFLDGKDIHIGNAAMVFGPLYKKQYDFDLTYEFIKEAKKIDGQVKDGKLSKEAKTRLHELALEARNRIKSVAFGMNYGLKENKLARQLGITKDEALAIMSAYLETYPAVQQFYDDAIGETRETGYSFTLLGRRRFHPAINSHNNMDRWSEERKAVNNQIQGTAADAVRLAMLACHSAKLDYLYGCKMLMQVHDELMFECPEETAQEARAHIKHIMEHPFPTELAVPLDVSIGIGKSWNTAK